jgi:hypothetical protein
MDGENTTLYNDEHPANIYWNCEPQLTVAGNLTYNTYFAVCDDQPLIELNDENIAYDWFYMDNLPQPLHFGVNEALQCSAVKRKIKKYLG